MKKGLRPLALRQWTTRQQSEKDASNKSPPCGGGFPNGRVLADQANPVAVAVAVVKEAGCRQL
jgi:hypothetical protein